MIRYLGPRVNGIRSMARAIAMHPTLQHLELANVGMGSPPHLCVWLCVMAPRAEAEG